MVHDVECDDRVDGLPRERKTLRPSVSDVDVASSTKYPAAGSKDESHGAGRVDRYHAPGRPESSRQLDRGGPEPGTEIHDVLVGFGSEQVDRGDVHLR